ncbi:MAG: hypothetical protein ACR2JU_07035 [Nocardioidaceae bacterium]
MDDEPSWQRQLVIGLCALLAIAVLVGGILALIAVRAADYVGIGDTSSSSDPALVIPTANPPSQTPAPAPTTTPPTSAPTSRPPPKHLIALVASPRTAGSFERVNLTGRYPGSDGATLQVQRSLGSGPWSDFPTTTTVQSGTFATYIQTSMVGVNHFRMVDEATGKTSNPVTVTIG